MRKLLVVLAMIATAGLGLLSARASWAVEVDGVYEAEVPVNSQQADDRTAAIRLALSQVLVKASGRSDAATMPDINQVLDQASRYVEQFRYRRTPPSQQAAQQAAPGTGDESLYLWVRFDARAVDHVLRSHDLPVWGRARPVVLVWLAVQSQGRRELIGADSQDPSHDLLLSEAARRGLPLRFPLLDLTDRSKVSASDVWGGFQDSLLEAAKRYQADGVLIGRVYQDSSGMWHASWSLYERGERQAWNAQGGALAEVIDPGIDQSADVLSQRFAQVQGGTSDTSVLLRVDAVKTLADYTRVVNYLSALAAVKAVEPASLDKDGVILSLTVRGDRLGLVQAISLGHTLANVPETAAGDTANTMNTETTPSSPTDVQMVAGPVPELVYRLLP